MRRTHVRERGPTVEIASRHRCRRQGRPLANLTDAHPVIVLADEGGDASVVKAILAVKVLDQDFSQHPGTIGALTDRAVTPSTPTRSSPRSPPRPASARLSAVFRDLLDCGGDESCVARIPGLTGQTYGEALRCINVGSAGSRQRAPQCKCRRPLLPAQASERPSGPRRLDGEGRHGDGHRRHLV
jgi:hypothetical protein